jgi:glutamate dehydrogenase (NAD(P)+)
VSVGGSLGRKEATGRGILYLIQQLCRDKEVALEGATVAVQGFGNVGGVAATLLAEEGARVVAVSDSSGGLHSGKGLDVAALWASKSEGANLSDLKGGDRLSGEEVLTLPVDFLVPAALEGQITGQIARGVRARFVVEGANGPTTPDGDAVLADKNVLVVPDILANAGGIIVSYFEWVQDLQFFFWEEVEVRERLQRAITRAYREVCALAEKERASLREAAMLLAVSRVEEATRIRGIYP